MELIKIKTTLFKIKNTLYGMNRRLETAEEMLVNLKTAGETIHNETELKMFKK